MIINIIITSTITTTTTEWKRTTDVVKDDVNEIGKERYHSVRKSKSIFKEQCEWEEVWLELSFLPKSTTTRFLIIVLTNKRKKSAGVK